MVIEDSRGPVAPVTIKAKDIPVGQVFEGRLDEGDVRVYLRAYEHLIDLKQPRDTWDGDSLRRIIVTHYIPRDAKVVLL